MENLRTPTAIVIATVLLILLSGSNLHLHAQPAHRTNSFLDLLYRGDFDHIGTSDLDKARLYAVVTALGETGVLDCQWNADARKDLGLTSSDVVQMVTWVSRRADGSIINTMYFKLPVMDLPGHDTYTQTLLTFAEEIDKERRANGKRPNDGCQVEWVRTIYKNALKVMAAHAGIHGTNGGKEFIPGGPRSLDCTHACFGVRAPNGQDLRATGPAEQKRLQDEIQQKQSDGDQLITCTYSGGTQPTRVFDFWRHAVPEMSAALRAALPSVLPASLPACPRRENSLGPIQKSLTMTVSGTSTQRVRPLDLQKDGVRPTGLASVLPETTSDKYFYRLLNTAVSSGQQILVCSYGLNPSAEARFWSRALPLKDTEPNVDYLLYVEKWYNVYPAALNNCPASSADTFYFSSLYQP